MTGIDTSNILYVMRMLNMIWNKMSQTPVPGIAGLTWTSLLIGVASISVAVAVLNRFTGTEGLGIVGSASSSFVMGVRNQTLKHQQRKQQKFESEQNAIISKYRKR